MLSVKLVRTVSEIEARRRLTAAFDVLLETAASEIVRADDGQPVFNYVERPLADDGRPVVETLRGEVMTLNGME
jgi:hypothetical protein